jgi:CRP-like cAMP-binding protein
VEQAAVDRESLFPILKRVTVFSGIDDEGLRRIFDACPVITCRTGEVIVREGTPATEIFLILSGRVKIVLNRDCEPFELIELGPGHCFGEASVIGIQSHSASVIGTEDSQLMVLSRQVLMQTLREDKDLFSLLILNIAREIARRLHHTDEILLHYANHKNGIHPLPYPGLT